MMETAGGSRTLGRVFGYLLLADKPRTLDQIANDLLFSKATASLTARQGLLLHFFEKVSIPGERKDYYRANVQSWINSTFGKIKLLYEWEALVDCGVGLLAPENKTAVENLKDLKDYFTFCRWYLSGFKEQYELWKKDGIQDGIQRAAKNE